ncbi:hypothetical protein SAMN05216359_101508 [Roseateles sp. YR242]|uniref:alpha/beta hydrolase n=1 Tax=Roseateles sp. YR242 TaxID=1855305 RepID=UPI0008D712C0|nr:alpha/beta hydrolase-fold protein [Roseateles sp. YR242]SEK34689.1 hypothetical protein SAMN05216359_101508 [Roseateles sp. YR242]
MINRRQLAAAALAPLLHPSTASLAATSSAAAPSLPDSTGPYSFANSFVHPLPDPVSGRPYEVWVDLPPGVQVSPTPLPAVFVTDAPYAFPLVRALRHRVGQRGQNMADFAVVGLGGPADESATDMRNRDYTPTNPMGRPPGQRGDLGGRLYGGGAEYLRYVADVVVPAVSARYNLDPKRRVILGHSYGALFASQILFERPALFSHYVLGSPSFWFDHQVMFEREAAYARTHRDLAANVFQYVGAYEAIARGPRYNSKVDLVADMRRFESLLKRRAYRSLRIESHVLAGEDHLTVAPAGATAALLWALPGRGPYTGG